ncbi:MAG: iron ABC transporter permease [Sandaracinaceae bacterium]|nr:iron ABC transporter permease [Sandaracinaceae bacterium]MDW8246722.1 iron ABC transporter permease [Sandaracinaceae bacterium]
MTAPFLRTNPFLLWVISVFLWLFLFVLSLCVGVASITPFELLSLLLSPSDPIERTLIVDIRLPRVLVASLCGAALAASGTALQSLFHNPLADPGVLGVSSGAGLAAVLGMLSGLATHSPYVIPISSALGAMIISLILIAITIYRGHSRAVILIVGVALSTFCSALTSLALALGSSRFFLAQEMLYWLLGNLDARTWDHVWAGLIPITGASLALHLQNRELDALQLGATQAEILGVDLQRTQAIILATSSILVGTSVSIAGPIAFVGLLVPNIARTLVGGLHRALLPTAMLWGALLVLASDLLARTIIRGEEIPIGVITGLLGAPALLVVARRHGIL